MTSKPQAPQIDQITQEVADAARRYLAGGLSIIPARSDDKRPGFNGADRAMSWKAYQTAQPSKNTLENWLRRKPLALAVCCGEGSGGLEILDFDANPNAEPNPYDAEDMFGPWWAEVGELCEQYGIPTWKTGGAGYQVGYRCPEPAGNEKLAWIPDDTQEHGRSVAIETRGAGGYALIPPSLHPSGNRYEMISGDLADVPTIPQAVRDVLIQAARALDLMPLTKEEIQAAKRDHAQAQERRQHGGESVIDAFNQAHRIEDLLARHGYTASGRGRYSRPGQPESHGVIVLDDGVSFHWSSNDPLHKTNAAGRPLPADAFDVYRIFEHGGDFRAAVKAAAAELGIQKAPRQAQEPPGGLVAPDLPPNTPQAYSNGNEPPGGPPAGTQAPSADERAVIDLLVSRGNLDMLRHALADMDRGVLGYVKHQADAAGLFANADLWARFVDTCRFKADPLSDQIRADLRKWEYFFRMNDLDDVIEVNGRPIDDGIRAQIRVTARDDGYGDRSRRSLTALEDVCRAEAAAHRFHPVKDYLNGLEWDGRDHFAELAGHFTDKHDPILYAAGMRALVFAAFLWRWMLGAVAKTFDAGAVRAQNPMLVIVGGQGLGKSTFCQYLASPLPSLFVASPVNPDSTDHRRLLATRWIWEAGELGATVRKADREALKEFLTLPDVTFRKPYDRDPIQKAALTSFLGTLNPEQGFLNDPTGSRRFLVVELATIDHAYIDAVDINQVWAQVMAHYRQDRNAYMLRRAEVETRNKINGLHETERPFESLIRKYFAIDPEQTGADWWIMSADVADRLQTVGNVRAGDSGTQKAIGYAMKSLGVERKQRKVDGSPVWGYQGIQQRERGISTPDPDDDQGNQ